MRNSKVFRCAIMIFFVGSLGVNLVWAEEIFCAVGWNGEFTHISPTLGEIEPTKFILPTKLQALAWSRDGTLYAGKEGALYTIDPYTGNTELVVVVSTSIRGMAFSPSNDLYVTASITFGQQNLRILDIATGDYSDLGALWGDNTASQGLAFSPDGTLYGITANKIQVHELYTIDLDDYEMHLIGSYLMPVDVSQSLTFTPDGSLYAVGDGVFAQLNPDTGAVIGTPISLDGDYRGLAVISGPSAPLAADANGPYTLYAGNTLTLDASGSTDDENDITSYVWDLNDDGVFETDAGTQAIINVSYAYLESLGLGIDVYYNIHLKVTDGDEQADTDTTTLLLVANIASADIFGTGNNQFAIDFVNISGDASSANGTNISEYSSGDIYYKTFSDPGDFRIGKFEITNDQWDKFKAQYGTVTGNPSSAYDENDFRAGANLATTQVSWYEAAQFVNWLNTFKGYQAAYKFTGTQGTGNYTFTLWDATDIGYDAATPYRNSNAYYFLPTEEEWVKAAYWNGTSLQTYSTIDDTLPEAGIDTNYDWELSGPWDVDSGIEELNGTYNMMGNVYERTESPYVPGNYSANPSHAQRGGHYGGHEDRIMSSHRYPGEAWYEANAVGFRVASVPEPVMISLDIKPQSCPNPFNVKSKGVLPVAILGTEEFDVSTIVPTSVRLAGVEPIRDSLEDVAAPLADPNECECSTNGPDGFIDLTLKFDIQAVLEALGEVNTGDILTLPLTGVLNDETSIEGADCVVIVGRFKPINKADINKDGLVNIVDITIVTENWLNSSIVEE